jgi:hypothetical protein
MPQGLTVTQLNAPPTTNPLTFTLQTQAQSNWCWAAVTASVVKYYEPTSAITQCSLANTAFGKTSCCTNPGSNDCNKPYVLETALAGVNHLSSHAAGPLSFSAVQGQIDATNPVGFQVHWRGGGFHVGVIAGYATEGSTNQIDVLDPWFGHTITDFATFPQNYQAEGTTWSWSFLIKS